MNRRTSGIDQSQFKSDQNHANYVQIDSCDINYPNSQRVFKKLSASNLRRSAYKNPEAVIGNYETYFVPVTNYNSIGTTNKMEQGIHAHYSYSANSLSPTYVHSQDTVNDGRNKIIYLKYPSDYSQLKDPKYYSQSNYLLKQQEKILEYGIVPQSQNYSYIAPGNKSTYKNSAQLPKIVYSSYVPEVDIKFAKNTNVYYPYSSEPFISSQRSTDDLMDYIVNKSDYIEEPEKISANKAQAQKLSRKFPKTMKQIPRSNVSDKMNYIAVNPCNEIPTKQHCTINANTQTSNHILKKQTCNEYIQTEYKNVGTSRTKETQTLNYNFDGPFFGAFINNLVKKGHYIYSFYLRTTVIRWLRRIFIELAWSIYNCPSNCLMQDRIFFSYLNHIESKSPLEANECQNFPSLRSPSRQSCTKQRAKY